MQVRHRFTLSHSIILLPYVTIFCGCHEMICNVLMELILGYKKQRALYGTIVSFNCSHHSIEYPYPSYYLDTAMNFLAPKILSDLGVVLQPLESGSKWAECPNQLNVGEGIGKGNYAKVVVRGTGYRLLRISLPSMLFLPSSIINSFPGSSPFLTQVSSRK